MALPTITIISLVVVAVIFVVITVVYWTVPATKDQRINGYLSALVAVSLFLGVLSFVISSNNQVVQAANIAVSQDLSLDYGAWLSLEQRFASDPNLLRLYQQIYPNNIVAQYLPTPPVTPDMVNAEIHMTSIMFQTMASINESVILSGGTWANMPDSGWLAVFRSWFLSPIVREQWELNKQFFGTEAIDFVNTYVYPYIGAQIDTCGTKQQPSVARQGTIRTRRPISR